MVPAHLAVDISARCEAEGEGREQTGLGLSAVSCRIPGKSSANNSSGLWEGSKSESRKQIADTQALQTRAAHSALASTTRLLLGFPITLFCFVF